jgi:PncC family amidohydrolase
MPCVQRVERTRKKDRMTTQTQLAAQARRLGELLKHRDLKIVFAESCTGGLISASLTRIPGISAYLCGSAVVYQVETKTSWLGISPKILNKPGPVSRAVALEMAEQVLKITPAADVSASVTGYLGPGAPKRQDGVIYVAVAQRTSRCKTERPRVVVRKHRLTDEVPVTHRKRDEVLRLRRQLSAARFVLAMVGSFLDDSNGQ